jgi:CBS domain-containing protein
VTSPQNPAGPGDAPQFAGARASIEIYMAENVVFADPDATLAQVSSQMMDAAVGALVLGSVEQVEGIVSERDVVRAVAGGADPATITAGELASKELVWCEVGATVAEVTELMMERYVRHVVVEADGRLAGIVSARDLLGAYVM